MAERVTVDPPQRLKIVGVTNPGYYEILIGHTGEATMYLVGNCRIYGVHTDTYIPNHGQDFWVNENHMVWALPEQVEGQAEQFYEANAYIMRMAKERQERQAANPIDWTGSLTSGTF